MFAISYGKDHKTDWSLRSIKLQVLSNASYQNLFLYLLGIIRPKSDSSETTVTYDQFPRHLSNQQRQINATQSPAPNPISTVKVVGRCDGGELQSSLYLNAITRRNILWADMSAPETCGSKNLQTRHSTYNYIFILWMSFGRGSLPNWNICALISRPRSACSVGLVLATSQKLQWLHVLQVYTTCSDQMQV